MNLTKNAIIILLISSLSIFASSEDSISRKVDRIKSTNVGDYRLGKILLEDRSKIDTIELKTFIIGHYENAMKERANYFKPVKNSIGSCFSDILRDNTFENDFSEDQFKDRLVAEVLANSEGRISPYSSCIVQNENDRSYYYGLLSSFIIDSILTEYYKENPEVLALDISKPRVEVHYYQNFLTHENAIQQGARNREDINNSQQTEANTVKTKGR